MSTLLDFILFSLLSQVNGGCEQYRFISGLDEMALPCEIGLYFDFNVTADGIPSGCPGLELFNATYFDLSKQKLLTSKQTRKKDMNFFV